jgi:antitoxin (DNA-binding transcriptional repressor) of toxin-antitoxin stability system
MKRVNVASMKSRLSLYLEYVRRGGTIRIFDRDQPVADLVPLESRREASGEALAALMNKHVRNGVIHQGRGAVRLSHRRARSKKSVVEALLDERREGR